jgi:hypothetical protein
LILRGNSFFNELELTTMKSTDIRTLRALSKPTRFSIPDSRDLHLWVRADLKKYWVYRFTFEGKRYDTSLGSFPEVSLTDAKNKAIKLRGNLLNGENPLAVKKPQIEERKPTITFSRYALEYINRMAPKWSNFTPNTLAQNFSLTDRLLKRHFYAEAVKRKLFAT